MANNLDNISSGYRSIRDGKEYEAYFGEAEQKDRVIIENGEVNETVQLMKKVVWKYRNDTEKIAKYLKSESLEKTAENVWNFLYNHVQYKLDKRGVEQLRRPNRSWYERKIGIDCDCFSIFVSSILTNLNIPHDFRIARYDEDYFQHVYVIIPREKQKYLTIDCVLSQFDYEKPYTEKRDFSMSINGINVAVLSGTLGGTVLDMAEELEGLGSIEPQQRADALYNHLVRTKEIIANNPYCVMKVEYPPAFVQMLDYAIQNWNTPNRDKALEVLEKNEEQLNRINGLESVEEHSDLEGLDTDWSELEGLEDHELLGEITGLGKAKKKSKPTKKKFFSKVKEAVKKGTKAMIRYNPIAITARNGFLLAMKLNIKKMASKLKWAYATQEQANKKGISTDQWKRSKQALAKIEKLFADTLQGKRETLKNVILKGKAGGLNGTDSEFDLNGLGSVAVAATISSAIPVIMKAVKALIDSGLMSKKDASGLEKDLKSKSAEGQSELEQSGLFEEIPTKSEKAASSSSAALMPMNEEGMSENTTENASEEYSEEEGSGESELSRPFTKRKSKSSESNGVVGFLKRNPLVAVAGAGLLLTGAYFAFSPKKKSGKGMAGTKGKSSRTTTTKTQKVRKYKRKSGIQKIKLS